MEEMSNDDGRKGAYTTRAVGIRFPPFYFFKENGESHGKNIYTKRLEIKFCKTLYSWYFSLTIIVFA